MKPISQRVTIDILFENSYDLVENGCWEWTSNINNMGVPVLIHNDKINDMRRWSYHNFIGPVPKNYFVYQECKNRKCVNPDHLKCVKFEDYEAAMNSFEPLVKPKKPVGPEPVANKEEPSGSKYQIDGPDGGFYMVDDLEPFCKEHGLQVRFLQGIADGRYTQHKGYTCKYNIS